jgi:hypothetical protein
MVCWIKVTYSPARCPRGWIHHPHDARWYWAGVIPSRRTGASRLSPLAQPCPCWSDSRGCPVELQSEQSDNACQSTCLSTYPAKTTSLILLGKKYKRAKPTHCNVILPRAFQIRKSDSELYVYKLHLCVPAKSLTSSMTLTPYRSTWNFRWTKLLWLGFFSPYLVYLQSVSFHKKPTVIFTYRLPNTVLAIEKNYARRQSSLSVSPCNVTERWTKTAVPFFEKLLLHQAIILSQHCDNNKKPCDIILLTFRNHCV